MAGSSSSAQEPPNPSVPQPPPPSSTASRRLPPPCWSHDETVALIDAYREKWYSLRRGNLRASHWQEVADGVAERCPLFSGSPQKTSVQCRHKMEKLRKRYRAEIQRAAATPTGRNRYSSAWVHFKRMDSMEKGPPAVAVSVNTVPIDDDDDDDDDDDEEDDEEYQENFHLKNGKGSASYSQIHYGSTGNGNGGNGFRIRIPSRSNMVHPPSVSKFDEFSTPSPKANPNFGNSKNFKDGYMGKFGMGKSGGGGERVGKKRERDPAAEMVAAIKVLGDGFVRTERMKMEMAREAEAMRMEMEVKRTEMILESQQRIVESFAKAISERKNRKVKRIPSPES